MNRSLVRSVSVHLTFFTIASDRVPRLTCRACRSALDLHQPNAAQPDQFLGTCPECGLWYRVESRLDDSQAVVVQLPGLSEITPTASL